MKNTLRQVFHSPKFVGGFVIFLAILLTMFIYPLFNPGNPLQQIGVGTFAKPGTYVSLYDATKSATETFRLPDADENRLAASLTAEDRVAMVEYFTAMEIDISDLDLEDTDTLLQMWEDNYDPDVRPKGMTGARVNYFRRLNNSLQDLKSGDTLVIAEEVDGELVENKTTGTPRPWPTGRPCPWAPTTSAATCSRSWSAPPAPPSASVCWPAPWPRSSA